MSDCPRWGLQTSVPFCYIIYANVYLSLRGHRLYTFLFTTKKGLTICLVLCQILLQMGVFSMEVICDIQNEEYI